MRYVVCLDCIPYLLQLASEALKSESHRYRGCTAEEVVDGLANLAANDKNKLKVRKAIVLIITATFFVQNNYVQNVTFCINVVGTKSNLDFC